MQKVMMIEKKNQLNFVESQEWVVETHCDGCGTVCFLEICTENT